MTQNLAYNSSQYCQVPAQNKYLNVIVSQQQIHNNIQIPWQNYAPHSKMIY